MNISYEQLGKRIRDIRKSKKLTQESLAEKTGLTHVQIGNIENAKSRPSIESLINISEVLQVSTDELLFGGNRFSDDKEYMEYTAILKDCNDKERRVIIETVKTLSNEIHKL